MAFGSDQPVQRLLAVIAFRRVLGQKDIANGVVADLWQIHAELAQGDTTEELVWHPDEDTSAVARIGFATARTAVVHVLEDDVGVQDDLMARLAFDVSDESNTARILFQIGIVKSLLFWETKRCIHAWLNPVSIIVVVECVS